MEASVRFDAKTVKKLAKIQSNFFYGTTIRLLLALAVILISLALSLETEIWVTLILVAVASFLLLSSGSAAREQEQAFQKAFPDRTPEVSYRFGEGSFSASGIGEAVIRYKQLTGLLETAEYLILLVDDKQLLLVDRATAGEDRGEMLKAFLAEKSGRTWGRYRGIFTNAARKYR